MPSKDFAQERPKAPLAAILAGVAVIVGIGIFSFGFWLAWPPLGFISGGSAVAILGVLLGRKVTRSVRSRS